MRIVHARYLTPATLPRGARLQCGDKRLVGLEDVLIGQACRGDPLQALPLARPGRATVPADDPQRQLHFPVIVGVGQAHEGERGLDFYAEFFAKLALKRCALALVAVDLAAGKLPAPGHVLACRPLGDEHLAVCVVERRGHHEDALAGDARKPLQSVPWQCLNFLPEPHGHGSLRPTLRSSRTKGVAGTASRAGTPGGNPAGKPPASLGAGAPPPGFSIEPASGCCACSARISRSRRSSSSRSISSWV